MKEGIRAIGIDDGPQGRETLVVGVSMRRDRFEGVLSTRVSLNGTDATDRILKMLAGSRFLPQVHVIFLNGIAVAGFNLVNFRRISRELGLPVVVVTPNEPHQKEFEEAIREKPGAMEIWEELKVPVRRVDSRFGRVWYQHAGCTPEEAGQFISHFQVHSKIPEPLRIAHIIAAGIELGESRGS